MATDNKEVAIRKRQQIDSSKKTMFIFVASAAFLAGNCALFVSIFFGATNCISFEDSSGEAKYDFSLR